MIKLAARRCREHKIPSVARKGLGRTMRRLAAVVERALEPLTRRLCQVLPSSSITKRPRLVIRSAASGCA